MEHDDTTMRAEDCDCLSCVYGAYVEKQDARRDEERERGWDDDAPV